MKSESVKVRRVKSESVEVRLLTRKETSNGSRWCVNGEQIVTEVKTPNTRREESDFEASSGLVLA